MRFTHTEHVSLSKQISDELTNLYLRIWAAFTYQKPVAPLSPTTEVFKNVNLHIPDADWRPYAMPGDAAKVPRPGHGLETAKEFAKLSQIIHQTITVWCGSRGRVTARNILQLYRRYLTWREELPNYLAYPNVGEPLAHCFSMQ
jgi:hypothetical protein